MRRKKIRETSAGQLGISVVAQGTLALTLLGILAGTVDIAESIVDPAQKNLKYMESMRQLPVAGPGECYYAFPALRTDFEVSATGGYKITGLLRKISPFHEAMEIRRAVVGSLPAYIVKSCAILDINSPTVFLSREAVVQDNRKAIESLTNNFKALRDIYPNVTQMRAEENTVGKKLEIWHP